MSTSSTGPVLLTVRGTTAAKSVEAARTIHNDTAGSEPGKAAARSLGDLTHKVFTPAAGAGDMSGAKDGELLFLDVWDDAAGIQQFFSNAEVQKQGGALFTSKEPNVWMPARGGLSFHLPAQARKSEVFLGIIRGAVKSGEDAVRSFNDATLRGQRDARRRGQLSHELYFRLDAPKDSPELLGLDVWGSLEGMMEHYKATMGSGYGDVFAAKPAASIWQEAPGQWSEW